MKTKILFIAFLAMVFSINTSKSRSIQDFLDTADFVFFEELKRSFRCLDLRNEEIDNLSGIKNIPGIKIIESINLSSNNIITINKFLNICRNLHDLDLSKNKLQFIDNAFDDCQNLRLLNLSNNDLFYIDVDYLLSLPKLKHLNLSNNHLSLSDEDIQRLEDKCTDYFNIDNQTSTFEFAE